MTKSYFQEQGQNYIGVPYGVLHTNKASKDVNIYDFLGESEEAPTENFKNHYKVVTCDSMVSLELHSEPDNSKLDIYRDISIVFNGQWLGLP